MSWIRRFLGISALLLGLVALETARADEPIVGAFLTLEKVSSGLLKYASTKSDGTIEILDLPNGAYRMSITPPSKDHGPDFTANVRVDFSNIKVEDWSPRTQFKAEAAGAQITEDSLLIPAQLWVSGALWLDVIVIDRTVGAEFHYFD